MAENGEDDFGSLFEGMILTDPFQISPDDDLPPPESSDDPLSQSQSQSQPLDVNLFSDLTLVLDPSEDAQTNSSPSSQTLQSSDTPEPPSRQISRKKKRAVKIGYAREVSDSDNHKSPLSHPLPDPLPEKQPVSGHELVSSSPKDICSSPAAVAEIADTKRSPVEFAGKKVKEVDVTLSSEKKLEFIKGWISEKVQHVRETAASVSAARKESTKRRRKATDDLNLASAKFVGLEKQLEEACEAEDFERAERVSESLAEVEKEKQGFLNALRDAEADCDTLESKMQEVLEMQIAAEEEGASLLEEFAKDATSSTDLVLRTAEEFSSKEMETWLSLTESLEVKKMELEIEAELVKVARGGLKDSIERSIEDDKQEKELLNRKKEVLTEELEKLLALVRLKEAEIVENGYNIKEVEQRIANAISGFQEAQLNIDTKYDNLQLSLSRIDFENEALCLKKKKVDEFLSLEEEKRSKLSELAQVSANEAKICQELVELRKSLAASSLKSREDKFQLAKFVEKIAEEIVILRQRVSAARTTLQELSSIRASIQQDISSSKQRLSFIDKRGPELEAEKKVAAAARNFKEAGRIAAEAKALSVEKANIQKKMEKSALELAKVETSIQGTINQLQENEESILSKEKEQALAECKRLKLVAAAARAERAAALELNDLEEAAIFLAEAETADLEAEKLQQAYGFEVEEETLKSATPFVSLALITNLAAKELAEMAAYVNLSTA